MADLKHLLSILTVPSYFLVVFMMYRRGLWSAYPFFCSCLLFEGAVLGLLLLIPGFAPKKALFVYQYSQAPLWCLYVFAVLEIFQKVFASFPGIALFAKRVIWLALLAGFGVALFSTGSEMNAGWSGTNLTLQSSVVVRVASSALTVYMILISAFLVWMPVPLPKNTIRHSVLFFFYLLFSTGIHYVLNTSSGPDVQLVNALISALTLSALAGWLFLLRPEGEAIPAVSAAPRHSSSEMLDRLEALNRALSKRQG